MVRDEEESGSLGPTGAKAAIDTKKIRSRGAAKLEVVVKKR